MKRYYIELLNRTTQNKLLLADFHKGRVNTTMVEYSDPAMIRYDGTLSRALSFLEEANAVDAIEHMIKKPLTYSSDKNVRWKLNQFLFVAAGSVDLETASKGEGSFDLEFSVVEVTGQAFSDLKATTIKSVLAKLSMYKDRDHTAYIEWSMPKRTA